MAEGGGGMAEGVNSKVKMPECVCQASENGPIFKDTSSCIFEEILCTTHSHSSW